MLAPTLLLLPVLLASYVSAHGFVDSITIGGRKFTGPRPVDQRSNTPSIIHQVSKQDPIYGANNPSVNCGNDASRFPAAAQAADVSPGAEITFDWRAADRSKWPHDNGPMITYLASCGDQPCSEFDTTKARWFKIDQVGRKSGGNKEWFQADLFRGGVATVKLPNNIAPGNYLIRHEIIALHIAEQRRGAEYYASCASIRVTGSGTGRPLQNELVSFPGAYSDDDPGVFGGRFFDAGFNYPFPGPRVASFVTGGASGDAPAPTSTGNGNGGGAKPTKTPVAPGKTCKLKKGSGKKNSTKVAAREAAAAAEPTAEIHRRRLSRVMRRLDSHSV